MVEGLLLVDMSFVRPCPDGPDRIPDPPLKHLFDGDVTNVYDDVICNLCAGTPGPDLLRLCADIFEQATKHRMVLLPPTLMCVIRIVNTATEH